MQLLKTLRGIMTHPANTNHKFQAVRDFFRWQIGSRLIGGGAVVPWINNSKLVIHNGEAGLTGNIYSGLHEFHDMAFLLHFLREEDLFLDIGANRGSFTVLASAVRRAETFAFEPIPDAYAKLTINVRTNGIEDRVTTFNKGLADAPGKLRFTDGFDSANHVLASGEDVGDEFVEVDVITLDSIVGDRQPNLIKIDVEGFEIPVFNGATRTLGAKSLHAIIVELNSDSARYNHSEGEIPELLRSYDFESHEYDASTRTIRAVDRSSNSCNTLFLRDIDLIRTRLSSSGKFKVRHISV